MEMIPVRSSAIRKGGYDPVSRRLAIKFSQCHTHVYCGVPQHVHEGLMAAAPQGSYYDRHVRGMYPCWEHTQGTQSVKEHASAKFLKDYSWLPAHTEELGSSRSHCLNSKAVWVNTQTDVWHNKGQRWYGRTKHGAHACKKEAATDGERETRNGQTMGTIAVT